MPLVLMTDHEFTPLLQVTGLANNDFVLICSGFTSFNHYLQQLHVIL